MRSTNRSPLAAIALMAGMLAMPPLGQQRVIQARPNSLLGIGAAPKFQKPKPRRQRTQADVDAMHLADAKWARKGAKLARDAARSQRNAFTLTDPAACWSRTLYDGTGPARVSPGRRRCATRRR